MQAAVGQIANVIDVKDKQRAKLGSLQSAARATDPVFVETAVVDAFLKIDRHGTERGQAPPPIAPRINVCGTNRSEFV